MNKQPEVQKISLIKLENSIIFCNFIAVIHKNYITMSILKVIEIMASSETSWEDAVQNAVATANKTVKGIRSAWLQDQSVVVRDGKVTEFRVTCKISFEVFD
jgi:hypothetical protein